MPSLRFLLLSSELFLAYPLCLKAVLSGLWEHSNIHDCKLCTASVSSSVLCDLPCAVETLMILGCFVDSFHNGGDSMRLHLAPPLAIVFLPLPVWHPSTLVQIQCGPSVELLWDALGSSLNLVRDSTMSAM